MAAAALKHSLRQACLARRAGVGPGAALAFGQALALSGPHLVREAIAVPGAPQNPVISAYWPIGDEADTRPLLAALAAQGFTTALPVTGARGTPLQFRLWREGDPMVPGQMRIPEPAPELPAAAPDILFIPLAAFDRRGHRIGYGAGHYDCTLALLRETRPELAIGVGYPVQEIAEVPNEAHDMPLDFVLAGHDLIDCRKLG